MSIFQLARSNFRRSVREFGILIVSLAFSVFIFFNLQNVIYSDSMSVLKDFKQNHIEIIIKAALVVFVVFLFFFIWYASNVFLNQRKKEIGIYIFMGLDNGKIGRMYVLEAAMVGAVSLLAGLAAGILFSKLFQMILLRMSEISVDVKFSFSLTPVLITAGMFAGIYGFMILKGYYTLRTSSVLNLLSGARQKEIQAEKKTVTALRIIAGTGILLAGYVCAWKTGDESSLQLALAAVILVIAGVYLLYSGLIPAILRALTKNKRYLYRKERNLWMNSLAFRVKKNYRTYAMVTVLMICSVTVMALSIALKQRYEKMVHFDRTYTYQVISSHPHDGEEIRKGIEQDNEVEYWNQYSMLILEPEIFHTKYTQFVYGVISCSQVREAAEKAGLDFEYSELTEHQAVRLSHEILFSFAEMDNSGEQVQIGDDIYEVLAVDKTPYLGKLQTYSTVYIVSDPVYEKLRPLGVEEWLYNYQIADMTNLDASREYLSTLAESDENGQLFTGVNYAELEENEDSWIRVMYSLCLFMFVTLILAGGSILFLKTGNDAYEDRERYLVLKKLGIQEKALRRAVRNEICFTYYCPFALMVITSYFSVKALGNVMKEDLFRVNLWSAGMILAVFGVICAGAVKGAWNELLQGE